ncbi:MAG: hypothetical protein V4501_10670 [Pseudomonadota bacterium]
MCLRKIQNLLAILLGVILSTSVYASDVSEVIAQNIKGTKILDVKIEQIPHDDSLLLIVKTSEGERRFIVTKENIVAALAVLQNPERYGATNSILINRTIPILPGAKPLVIAKNPLQAQPATVIAATKAPIQASPTQQLVQTTGTASAASAIVSSMVLSANQQASK